MEILNRFICKYDLQITLVICILGIALFTFGCWYDDRERKSHEFAVTSSSGKVYNIDDYTIEDGSIIFSIDGVEYHFSDYSIRDIEK